MEKASELKLVSAHLEELRSLIHKLEEQKEQVHQIDFDLALEKVRRIYDDLCLIKSNISLVIPAKKTEVVVDREIIKSEPVSEVQPDVVETEPVKEPEVIRESIVESIKIKEEVKAAEPATSLIDLFSVSAPKEKKAVKKTNVEKMAGDTTVEILAEKIGKKKIAGLNQAIGINEKFFFINELFDGNMKEYKVAIDTIDQFESLANATEYFENLVAKNGWDKSGEAYTLLLDFVDRKFH